MSPNVIAALRRSGNIWGVAVLLWWCTLPAWAQSPPPLHTVPALDVPRYMGRWYEIAKFPNWFQRVCASQTQASYALQPDGTVRVLNRCRDANGEWKEALGTARSVGEAHSPKLQVRFAPDWLAWLPLVWGNYWVIDLDASYQLVAVSEPSREYLWVLSRTPQVATDVYQALLQRLRAQGLDTERLERTPQLP